LFEFLLYIDNYPVKLFFESIYDNKPKFSKEIDISLIKAFGLNPKGVHVELNKATLGKNLVLIYLESIEKIYTENSIFPLLTPSISDLMEEGITFNEFVQTQGTGSTIAGIFASQCGTPLLLESMMSSNDIMSGGYFQNAICLGDILRQAGYYQVYMGGGKIDFAGKSSFLLSHGYNDIKGFDELKFELNHQNYRTGWGLYDDTLFELAAGEYSRLADRGQPFNLTLLSLDTHRPGMPSRSCIPYTKINNSILNAVHCTDQLLMKFINTISSHPSYKNTIVAIITDHLTMRSVVAKYYPKDYKRRLLFIIMNTAEQFNHNGLITHMDVAPTLLSALGITYDSYFICGRNILEAGREHSPIDYSNPDLIEIIKHINSKYLSDNQHYSLFGADFLVELIASNEIRMGNKRVRISYEGNPLSVNKFIQDFAIIIFINDDGFIMDLLIVHLNDLVPLFLKKEDTDTLFMLVAPNKNLPLGLNHLVPQQKSGLSVFLGRFCGPVVMLGSFDKLTDLEISSSKINDTMKSFGGSTDRTLIRPLEWLSKEYKDKCTERRMIPFYNGESRLINIPCIKVGPRFYKASLKMKNKALFELEKVTLLKGINESCCCAYFAFEHLFMPLALDNGLIEIVKLETIPETRPLLFKSETIGVIDRNIRNF